MPSKHSEITFAKYGLGVYCCKGMKIELDRLKVHRAVSEESVTLEKM